MHIINTMFGRGRGGIEQAALDYAKALQSRGHKVTSVLHPNADMLEVFGRAGLTTTTVANFSRWDPFAINKLKKLIAEQSPDAIICHGNRALSLLSASAADVPVIGVAHNYNLKHFKKASAAFAITRDLLEELVEMGFDRAQVFYIPNMIEIPSSTPRPFHTPPVIGSMGRFVPKKGFIHFIRALALLKARGVQFRAVLGGGGEQNQKLHRIVRKLTLQDVVTFTGWVEDKRAFFESIDMFCLPSLHEPFGIVLLEAFAYYTPLVTTDTEGPSDFIRPDIDALMVEKANATALADALQHMIENPAHAAHMAQTAHDKLEQRFALPVVAEQMEKALEKIVQRH